LETKVVAPGWGICEDAQGIVGEADDERDGEWLDEFDELE
jgi:hypothetical protein